VAMVVMMSSMLLVEYFFRDEKNKSSLTLADKQTRLLMACFFCLLLKHTRELLRLRLMNDNIDARDGTFLF
jgi:hypothetical protein